MSRPARPLRVVPLASTRDERGFTLVELLVVTVIVPIIIGALSMSLISVFSLQSSVSNRLGDSANSQVVTTNFTSDVQGAVSMTTSTSLPQCGTGTQLMGIELGSGRFVSYTEVPAGGTMYSLQRNLCDVSASPTNSPGVPGALISTTTLAYNVNQPCSLVVTLSCLKITAFKGTVAVPTSTWTPTQGITGVKFDLVASKSSLVYNVASEPLGADSSNPSQLGTTTTQKTCGFALPGTGTYARTLCFFDFAPYLNAGATSVSEPMTEYVPGGYVFTADLSISTSNSTVQPATFPTYPAAFLGNAIGGAPFYTGVGCLGDPTPTVPGSQPGTIVGRTSCISPAIYMYANGNGKATITLSHMTLKTSTGDLVTGYGIVTADAETTDANPESITWTSNVGFNQVPDTPTSPEGNACSLVNRDGTPTGGGSDLTPNPIVNATTVTCNDTYQEPSDQPRTGTVVLDVSPPPSGSNSNGNTTMTAVLASSGGKQAVSFGLLLP
ncbi:MAG: prepilin-type N-terminal cleavage/methylation domain-containing protein [Acidobacteria bacterium]|nr:prepilin-type N-terminal cleavage/methylation domain-containing protein [Acidobacteriota bacterium]